MSDAFAGHRSIISPADEGFDVAPSDSGELPVQPRAIFVGTGGNLAVRWANGDTSIFKNLPNGSMLSIRPVAVLVTGTTAQDMIGIY